ncbi:Na+/H+ antiporter NhaC family protein [Candidatus Clostridium radicumherbarum]|uniref:Na+/H+ antiporter NhaC family protein n=1 Tax=Candidatus Clostridium radicumherbarum TaxID=3381662 RepID=A0ABW8TM65_9CLOT
MNIIIAFIICFILLLTSAFKGIFIGYPLIISLVLFIILGIKRGFSFKSLLKMSYEGGKKSLIVLKIFILIGAITASWMASGTVPAIVYYGMKFLNPHIFILCTFLISSVVSFLIGTSFGTIGTVGIALMVMARGGGVSIPITAGAILSGAYFGDRCSPMSSSANLVASLTETDIFINIKNMFKTSIVPFILTCVIYTIFSINFPLATGNNFLLREITKVYDINIITLLPAAIILIFSIFKVNVKTLMLLSVLIASIIAVLLQHVNILEMLKYIVVGYSIPYKSTLSSIISGGGILSMLKISIVVFVSSAFTGIFEGTEMLKSIELMLNNVKGRHNVYLSNIIISIASAAFGCSQALAVILSNMLMKNTYEKNNITAEQFALDMENTSIIISPLIPWNIAVLVPLTTLNAGVSSIAFAFYLYLIPLANYIYFWFNRSR